MFILDVLDVVVYGMFGVYRKHSVLTSVGSSFYHEELRVFKNASVFSPFLEGLDASWCLSPRF